MKKLELGPTSTVEFEAKLTLMTFGDMRAVAELAATGEQFKYLGFVAPHVSTRNVSNSRRAGCLRSATSSAPTRLDTTRSSTSPKRPASRRVNAVKVWSCFTTWIACHLKRPSFDTVAL